MIAAKQQSIDWTLSGFGDEIDPDPETQIAVLQALGARHVEVRSAWGVNVVDLDDAQLSALVERLSGADMAVSAVASPIGKVDVDEDPESEVVRLERVIRVARALQTQYIRIFSFFIEGRSPEIARDAVLTRMARLAETAARQGVILLHENEKGIYGDTPERVLDLVETVASPALRLAWDSANFVQVGVAHPHDDGYAKLRPYLDYLQVKDARFADSVVVPAGEGDGEFRESMRAFAADGFEGFASLEPHLQLGHALGGFSGPENWRRAHAAFVRVLREEGIAYA